MEVQVPIAVQMVIFDFLKLVKAIHQKKFNFQVQTTPIAVQMAVQVHSAAPTVIF